MPECLAYDYMTNGQLSSITYPGAITDEPTAPTEVLSYEYNGYGQLENIKRNNLIARSYTYDDSGVVEAARTYLDFSETQDYIDALYTYNSAGLATQIKYQDDSSTILEQYDYSYNDNGMITNETLYTNYSTAETVNKSHVYDDIGRLTQTTSGSETTTYTYDEVGNRLSENDGTDTLTYQYDELYQLLSIKENNINQYTYQYDNMGRQTQQIEYSTQTITQNYTYLDNGMLGNVEITNGSASINESYLYNADLQRMIKDTDGELTKYFYSGSTTLITTDEENVKLTENIVTQGGQIVSSQRFDSNGVGLGWYFYNYDIRQSTTTVVDNNGSAVTDYDYTAFGLTSSGGSSSFLNEVQFTGAVSDTSTGLYYMNARYYNPTTGRFLTQDTYKGSAYEPWTQHLYTYVGNNPVNMVDPTGHRATEDNFNYKKPIVPRPTPANSGGGKKGPKSPGIKPGLGTKPGSAIEREAKVNGNSVSEQFWIEKSDEWIFPLYEDVMTGRSDFNTERKEGDIPVRSHAAVDLIVDPGSDPDLLAMADGLVIDVSPFFAGTYEIQVRCAGGIIIRYGEVSSSVNVGDRVTQGQVIGTVIQNTTKKQSSMLHLEIYLGTTSSKYLSQDWNNYYKYVDYANGLSFKRRSDLLDPSGVLNLPMLPHP